MRSVGPSRHVPWSEPNLSFDELRASLVELQPTLLGPEGFTAVFGNELWLWSWTTEMLIGVPWPESPPRLLNPLETESGPGTLLRLAAWTALADCRPKPAMDKEAWQEAMRKKYVEAEPNARQMVSNNTSVLAYLSFPLLEGLTKLRCSDYVDLDGQCVQAFSICGTQYDPIQRPNRVNNLEHLLWLLQDEVADTDERSALEAIRSAIAHAEAMDAYTCIFRWRNSQAHGVRALRRIAYTVYNLALLIGLHGIQGPYEAIRNDHRNFLDDQIRSAFPGERPHFMDLHYYPPYWEDIPPGMHYFATGQA